MTEQKLKRLIRQAQKGNIQAFEELIVYKKKSITYVAYRMLKNKHDVEDAVQDAVSSMYQNITNLKSAEAFHTWMTKIVFNACLKVQKNNKKREDFVEVEEESAVESSKDLLPYEHQADQEQNKYLLEKMDELPESYRQCLYFFYFEEMSYAEIAAALEMDEKSVSNQLHRARKRLRDLMEQDSREGILLPAGVLLVEESTAIEASLPVEEEVLSEAFSADVERVWAVDKGAVSSHALEALVAAGDMSKHGVPLGLRIAIPLVVLLLLAVGVVYIAFSNQGEAEFTAEPTEESYAPPANEQTTPAPAPQVGAQEEEKNSLYEEPESEVATSEERVSTSNTSSDSYSVITVDPDSLEVENSALFEVITEEELREIKETGEIPTDDPELHTNNADTIVEIPGSVSVVDTTQENNSMNKENLATTSDETGEVVILLSAVIAGAFIVLMVARKKRASRKN